MQRDGNIVGLKLPTALADFQIPACVDALHLCGLGACSGGDVEHRTVERDVVGADAPVGGDVQGRVAVSIAGVRFVEAQVVVGENAPCAGVGDIDGAIAAEREVCIRSANTIRLIRSVDGAAAFGDDGKGGTAIVPDAGALISSRHLSILQRQRVVVRIIYHRWGARVSQHVILVETVYPYTADPEVIGRIIRIIGMCLQLDGIGDIVAVFNGLAITAVIIG